MQTIINAILFTFICLPGFSQDDGQPKQMRNSFGIVPQSAVVSSFRFDFDVSTIDRQALVISPRFYFVENLEDDNWGINSFYNKLIGYGGMFYYRWYNNSDSKISGLYLAPAIGYTHFDAEYETYGWHDIDYDIPAQSLGEYTEELKIDQLDFQLLIGVKYVESRMFIDWYVGTGFKYSGFNVEREEVPSEVRTGFLSFGYSGFYPAAGIRFGLMFGD